MPERKWTPSERLKMIQKVSIRMMEGDFSWIQLKQMARTIELLTSADDQFLNLNIANILEDAGINR